MRISWLEKDGGIPSDGKDIVNKLLCSDPLIRLGSSPKGGAREVMRHSFFDDLDWESLLQQKAELTASLYGKGLEDTIYVDSEQIN